MTLLAIIAVPVFTAATAYLLAEHITDRRSQRSRHGFAARHATRLETVLAIHDQHERDLMAIADATREWPPHTGTPLYFPAEWMEDR